MKSSEKNTDGLTEVVTKTLERVRRKLLDLTRRNNLLNFRETRRTIKTIDASPDEIFSLLLTEGKSLELLPFEPPEEENNETQTDESLEQQSLAFKKEYQEDELAQSGDISDPSLENPPSTIEDSPRLTESAEGTAPKRPKNCLQTSLLDQPLERRCKNILRSWRSGIEEAGMNFLYLSIGFLEWYADENSDVLNSAPLILVPISIQRTRLNTKTNCYKYVISYSGEDIETNLSLAELLDRDFDLILPDVTDDVTPEVYFEAVAETIAGKPRWSVAREVVLGFFSFAKLRIYRDLNDGSWPDKQKITKHPIVKTILAGRDRDGRDGGFTFGEEYDIDGDPYVDGILLIRDADSSQHSAIADVVLKDKNLVIEGPPGTGKSQTITNLIASALNEDKTVLFVSEKKAALEVVRNRLDAAGLGNFCLELHSHKTQKGKLHADLANRLNQYHPDSRILEHEIKEFSRERKRLRSYYDLLNSVPCKTDETVFEIFGGVERWREEIEDTPVRLVIDNASQLTRSQINTYIAALSDFERLRFDLPAEVFEIWRGFEPGVLLPGDEQEIREQLSALLEITEQFADFIQTALESCGDRFGKDISTLRRLNEANTTALSEKPERWEENLAVSFLDDEVVATLEVLSDAIEEYRKFESEANKILGNHNDWSVEDLRSIEKSASRLEICGFSDSSPDDLQVLQGVASSTRKALEEFEETAKPIYDLLPEPPKRFIDFARVVKLRKILESAPYDISLHGHSQHALKIALPLQEKAHREHQQLGEALAKQSDYFRVDLLPNAEEIKRLAEVIRACASWLKRLFSSEYRDARNILRGFFTEKKVLKKPDLAGRLDKLAEIQQRINAYEENEDYRKVFGSLFRGMETEWQRLDQMISWSQSLANTIGSENCAKKLLSDFSENKERIGLVGAKLTHLWQSIQKGLSVLKLTTKGNERLGDVTEKIQNRDLLLGETLQELSQYTQICQIAIKSLREAVQAGISAKRLRSKIGDDSRFAEQFGEAFWGVDTETEPLQRMAKWITSLKEEGRLEGKLLPWLLSSDTDSRLSFIISLVNESSRYFKGLDEFIEKMSRAANFDFEKWLGGQVESSELSDLINKLNKAIEMSNHLVAWSGYCLTRSNTTKLGLLPIVQGIEDESIPQGESEAHFRYAFYQSIAKEVLQAQPELAAFQRATYDNVRERLAKLDQKIQQLSSQRIAYAISKRPVPPGVGKGFVRDYTELALIKHELTKKRRHIPIRQLVRRSGNALQALKPCFMMGPLSVAQYIAPGQLSFDLVVMDEASQLRLEDSLGAIARAEQAVVVGDPKQLPPTTFFERLNESALDDEDRAAAEEAEAILDICQNCFDNRRLRWHYRSEHESLIAFSNNEFYDNDLIVFPSPFGGNGEYGVHRTFVENATYQKRRNRIEAEAVALAIMEHFRRYPELSLGVATFNIEQRDLIQDEVERLQKKNSWLEERIILTEEKEEPFFIKNLENVQGDERDVIYISTTYGPDPDTGRVYNRFGPLLLDTGWRRLNVIVTRAKKRLHVFTSMRPTDINIGTGVSRGAVALRSYLEYAETGRLPDFGEPDAREPDSDFEIAVAKLLQQYGYRTAFQVGVAGFFIDIGVYHPDREGEFILGIECDGASYHAAKSIRDRDILRQKILESKGWKIWRIWSTDWFKNKDKELNNLLQHLEELVKLDRAKVRRVEPVEEPTYVAEPPIVPETVDFELPEVEVYEAEISLPEAVVDQDEELRNVLLDFRRKKIEPIYQDIAKTILADKILEAFVRRKPITRQEFFEIPLSLREQVTEPGQGELLEEIFEIIEEFTF